MLVVPADGTERQVECLRRPFLIVIVASVRRLVASRGGDGGAGGVAARYSRATRGESKILRLALSAILILMHIPRCYGRRAYRFKAWAMMALVHLQAMSLAGSYYYTPVSITVKPFGSLSMLVGLLVRSFGRLLVPEEF